MTWMSKAAVGDMKIRCSFDELVSIGEVKPHPKNRNKHPKDQIERLATILDYQGWRYPVKISKLSGFVTSGHGRITAAKKNGWDQIPVNYQDYDDEDQEYADVQADNAIASWAELDLGGINQDILDMGPDFDIDLLGIKDFTLEPAEKFEAQCDEDEVPEKVEPKTKLGDVYKLGRHRLVCGDATSIDAVEKLMAGEKADMVFTDPPYGMKLDTDYSKMGPAGIKHRKVLGDHEDFSSELIQTCFAVFSYVSEIFMFGADYYSEFLVDKNKGSWIVWDKRSRSETEIGTLDGAFGSDFELCFSKAKHKREIARVLRETGAFAVRGNDKPVHPTQKPIKLVEWFFERFNTQNGNVVDLFGGSGSTLIACEKTNRKCFMMELDPHYCDVIVARWEKYTGQTAELIDG